MFIFRQAGCVCSLVYKEVPDESCTFFTHKNEGTEGRENENRQCTKVRYSVCNYELPLIQSENYNKTCILLYVYRSIETCSCNHCCSAKGITVTCYECVSVALGTQHAMPMHHIVNCGLLRCTIIFPHCLINGTIFEKKSLNIN